MKIMRIANKVDFKSLKIDLLIPTTHKTYFWTNAELSKVLKELVVHEISTITLLLTTYKYVVLKSS